MTGVLKKDRDTHGEKLYEYEQSHLQPKEREPLQILPLISQKAPILPASWSQASGLQNLTKYISVVSAPQSWYFVTEAIEGDFSEEMTLSYNLTDEEVSSREKKMRGLRPPWIPRPYPAHRWCLFFVSHFWPVWPWDVCNSSILDACPKDLGFQIGTLCFIVVIPLLNRSPLGPLTWLVVLFKGWWTKYLRVPQ